MKTRNIALALGLGTIGALATTSVEATPAVGIDGARIARPHDYVQVINQTARMVSDRQAQALARAKGMQILNVMWEDTGRWKGSSLGPNISDVTIEVHASSPQYARSPNGAALQRANHRALMPVIRFPNFTDKTADVKLDRFFIRVGNQRKGGRMEVISLKEFLANPTRYMSLPGKGSIKGGTLLAGRDTHALVSAQAAFLPIPRQGKAKFYPVIFNYQSRRGHPAVLTLLVTRQGTSMTVIDNSRDGVGSWGQRLFFNKAGERAPLMAERLSDAKASGVTQNGESADSLGEDANLLMMVQVPLKYAPLPRRSYFGIGGGGAAMPSSVAKSSGSLEMARGRSDVESAVLGHGKVEGPYTELDGLTVERDPRFPVRVTVQFYQATSNGVISAADVERLSAQIGNVYEKGDYVGSLVVPERNQKRPTEWDGISAPPQVLSWQDFPGVVQWFNDNGWRIHRRLPGHHRPAVVAPKGAGIM